MLCQNFALNMVCIAPELSAFLGNPFSFLIIYLGFFERSIGRTLFVKFLAEVASQTSSVQFLLPTGLTKSHSLF